MGHSLKINSLLQKMDFHYLKEIQMKVIDKVVRDREYDSMIVRGRENTSDTKDSCTVGCRYVQITQRKNIASMPRSNCDISHLNSPITYHLIYHPIFGGGFPFSGK